jgi:hypothetical protein
MKNKILPFAVLSFSYFASIIFCLFNFSELILSDLNEIFRVPFFMILPVFIGRYLVKGDDDSFDIFCRFFVFLYIYNLLIIIFQFFNFFNGMAYTLYSQEGIGAGASRVTGVSLFIQECAWLLYIIAAVIVVYRYKKGKRQISGILLSVPSLLTLSKTVYISYILSLLPFSFNKKARITFKSVFPAIILLLLVGIFLFYLLKDNLQFIASIVDGFSNRSSSVSNRQNQIINLYNNLNDNKLGYIFGVMPILSRSGYRVEISFFNIFAKVGVIGLISYYCCVNILIFVKQKGPFYIILLKRIIMWIGISLSIASVTGGNIEGVKGMFFYFLVIGVILSYNTPKRCI